jgi:DNA-binding CsgD family transcriptional regulator/tetratricopeptide (TPR) repeat protein
MELLEREPLLAALDDRLQAAAAGSGSLVLLAGEAGIGKTSLARAFCDRHADEAEVWWGACDALTTPRALGPLYDIARDAGGDLAAVMASEASRHERFSGLLDALTSPLRPIIVVIEDLHWIDDATRDLLIYLARRVDRSNALIVGTYRDDEIGRSHPLRDALGHLATLPAVDRLTLPPLSETAVAALAAGHDADPLAVHRVTGGNPFFVTEILAAGADAVPATVADAVLARAGRLSPAARAALEAAAIVPDRAGLGLVRAVAGDSADAIGDCVSAGLLHPHGRSVRFRHELARLAIEQDISPGRLPELHAAALAHLAVQPDTDPARLAYHAERADDREAVLRHAPTAAARARRLGAHREAVAHYRLALQYADTLPAAEHAELYDRYADECTAVDQVAEAVRAAGLAFQQWQELGEVERAAQVMARRAYLLWAQGRSDAARRAAREAMDLLERRPPGLAHATAYSYAAHLHMLAREIPQAIEAGNRAIALATEFGDPALRARALTIVGAALWFTDEDQAEATLQCALTTARDHGEDTIAGLSLRMLGSGAGEVRRYPVADRWLAEGVRWCGEHDLDIHGDYCLAWSARSAFEQGRWSEAADAASRAAGHRIEHAPTRIVSLTTLGRLRVRRGDPDADTLLAQAWDLACQTGDLQRLWPVAAGRAEAAWLSGDPDRIPSLVNGTFQRALQLQQRWPIGELGYWLWKAGALEQAPPQAAEVYARQINGDWHQAGQAWEAIGCPYEAALARAEGDDPDQLRTALDYLIRLGARPMADRLTARLRDLGVRSLPRRPSRATGDHPAGLTARELEVLGLLVGGATNNDIATRLHISPKTAGHHVSAILTKLDVPTRRHAARTADELGIQLPPPPTGP